MTDGGGHVCAAHEWCIDEGAVMFLDATDGGLVRGVAASVDPEEGTMGAFRASPALPPASSP